MALVMNDQRSTRSSPRHGRVPRGQDASNASRPVAGISRNASLLLSIPARLVRRGSTNTDVAVPMRGMTPPTFWLRPLELEQGRRGIIEGGEPASFGFFLQPNPHGTMPGGMGRGREVLARSHHRHVEDRPSPRSQLGVAWRGQGRLIFGKCGQPPLGSAAFDVDCLLKLGRGMVS